MKRFFLAVGIVAVLAACGAEDAPTVSTDNSKLPGITMHNAADVQFVEQMVPHHQQALDMARLAPERASNERVQQLAAQIEAAQTPEIETMRTWVTGWNESTTTMDPMHAGHAMAGMMTKEQMDALRSSAGNAFDRRFLEMMIEHHRGAVEMADAEIKNGNNAQAKILAGTVKDTQTGEITQMRELLNRL